MQITDRHGDIVDEIPMTSPTPILALAWDKDGDNLAILQEGNGVVPLWSLSNRRIAPLETNLRDPVFLAWSKTGPQLAVGTAKGNLLIYNKTKKQKIPIVGKHAKKITCGVWSSQGNKLALGSDDKTLTISNDNGDTLLHTELKHVPQQCHFTSHNTRGDDDLVSSNLNGKSLHLLNIMDERDEPIELTFATKENGTGCKYGDIVQHEWLDNGLLLMGFSGGYLIIVATNSKEMGEEKNCHRFHQNSLICFSYNRQLGRVATAGEDGVRVVDLQDFKEVKSDFISTADMEDGRVTNLQWSPDGQILSVGTLSGNVYNFLAKMAVLNARYQTSVAYLSSLREISVVDVIKRNRPVDISLKLEPSFIALGGKHVAAGMNNRVYFHRIAANATPHGPAVLEQEYVGTVREVHLNQKFAAVLSGSKVTLHLIEQSVQGSGSNQTKMLPGREDGKFANITCVALTDDFLFYGTEAGTVEIFSLSEWLLLAGAELRLDSPIHRISPNFNGTRVVVVDQSSQIAVYNPVGGGGSQAVTKFDQVPMNVASITWDETDKSVILVFDGKYMHTYVYVQFSMKGSFVSKLGPVEVTADGEVSLKPDKVELAGGNVPLMSAGGLVTCQTADGKLVTILHPYFDQVGEAASAPAEKSRKGSDGADSLRNQHTEKFCQCLALLKLENAWHAALELDRRQFWLALGNKAMETLNVGLAYRIYRQLGDAAMVMALQELMHVEDRNLLAGHISLLFCDYQRAQDLFLASSKPSAALEMRVDLLHWDQALKLAQALDASQVPRICVSYGQHLEFYDDAAGALKMFETALDSEDGKGSSCPEALAPVALRGVARCNLRLGNLRQGARIANEISDAQLYVECGDILEQQKQYVEAVQMYNKSEQWERSAFMYTKYIIKGDKSKIGEASAIMKKVRNDQLNAAFAKACAAAGRYDDALAAYERAGYVEKVVELNLRHLDQVQAAFDLVRSTASTEGALLVADYCSETSDFRGAIEFLLLANKHDDAFKLAQTQGLVEVYASQQGEGISAEHALKIAHYYEKAQEFGKAGRFYSMCGQFPRALKLFMQCGDREISAAIDVVGKSQNEGLTHLLIDFLVGEKDGMPKDPNYIYRLYMALKKFEDAAKTALIIAKQEQDMGNYNIARGVLYETIRQLEDAAIKVPLQLRQHFVLLHSYILVKSLVRCGDHSGAARMLLRVAQNVSKFPLHAVPILTSTVIECQRAGMKATAYEYAVMLMRPEYRPSIDVNIKKKVEAIVRRRAGQNEEQPEEQSPCPISNEMIPVTQLETNSTRDALPMCVVSGRHLELNDWCFCPVSKFPALYSQYQKYVRDEQVNNTVVLDPLLGKPVALQDLRLAKPEDATKYIQKYNNLIEEKKEAKEGPTGKDGNENASDDNNTNSAEMQVAKLSLNRLRKAERASRRQDEHRKKASRE